MTTSVSKTNQLLVPTSTIMCRKMILLVKNLEYSLLVMVVAKVHCDRRSRFERAIWKIEAKLDKNSRCANHWIALSPDEYFTWNYEQEPRAIKAGWFCDYKFLITPRGNYSTKCNRIRNYNVSLKVKGNTVVFEDDQCGKLTGSVDMRPEYLDVYAFIGADHLAGNETITCQTTNNRRVVSS